MAVGKKALVLDRWYNKLGANWLGGLDHPQVAPIASFKFGFDPALVDEVTDPDTDTLLDIAGTQTPVADPFYGDPLEAPITLAFSNGRFFIKCVMPAGSIAEGQLKKHNITEIYDGDGDLMAVSLDYTTPLTETDSHEVNLYIDLPLVGGGA